MFADEPGSSDLSNKRFENIKRTNCELASIVGQAVTQTPIIEDRRAINSSKRQASSSSNPVSHTTFVNDETFANRLNVKDKVLTYIHPDDRSQAIEEEEEAYWVASIARKKPWQIANDGTFGGGEF